MPLGPRQARLHQDPTTGISGARAALLEHLTDLNGWATVADVADASGQHQNTVREHLEALTEARLVERTRRPAQGRGRPAMLYRSLPPEVTRLLVREYAALASSLAGHIHRTSPDPARDAVEAGEDWGRRLVERPVPDRGRAAADDRVLHTFHDLGFAPEVVDDRTVHLHECPLLATAREQTTVVCNVHLGLARGLFEAQGVDGDAADLEPFAIPGACILRLRATGGG